MEVKTIVESRIGEVDEVTASDWHLVGIQLRKRLERRKNNNRMSESVVFEDQYKRTYILSKPHHLSNHHTELSRRFPESARPLGNQNQRTSTLKVPIEVVNVAIDMVTDKIERNNKRMNGRFLCLKFNVVLKAEYEHLLRIFFVWSKNNDWYRIRPLTSALNWSTNTK